MHLFFEILAYIVGYRMYVWLRKRTIDPISDENRAWIFIGAAGGAFIGSHLLGVLERPAELVHFSLLMWYSNKTILGGLLGGLIGVETTKKLIGESRSSGDLLVFPLLVSMAIGRLGCHFAGLEDGTHGLPSDLPWAMDFGDGILRHPVNLYEIFILSAIACYLWWREQKTPLPEGMRFKIFMTAYLLWRFFAEWLKPVWWFPFGLTSIQMACLAGLFYYRKIFTSSLLPKT